MIEDYNELEKAWKKVEDMLEQRFGKIPNMESVLFLIGVNEFKGRNPKYKFSKEEKQDLMHVGTCTLLKEHGYYLLEKYDEDGWPHFTKIKELQHLPLTEQEKLLKNAAINYFNNL